LKDVRLFSWGGKGVRDKFASGCDRGVDSEVIEENQRGLPSRALQFRLKQFLLCQLKARMNDQQKKEVRDQEIRAALNQHWAASDANDFETEHRIYHEDAVLEYPQSGERTRGRRNIQNQRASQPNKKRFTVRRIIGCGDLWVTEFILTYDGKPSYTVSIMEFRGEKVARETQYFADPFVAPASRAQWVERMDT
jgi:hypothetical protein